MPELPEVETTRRGLLPHVEGAIVRRVIVRERRLRWRVPRALAIEMTGQRIDAIERRAKYLLFRTGRGTLLVHLGMSGHLRLLREAAPARKHEHLDIEFGSGMVLRYHDPRRFGCALWTTAPPEEHRLLAGLGPEPLGKAFDAEYLYAASRRRKVALRDFLLDGRIVAGVGNIYANEAAFLAGLRPARAAGSISREGYVLLVRALRRVLTRAIRAGGTTLRDFVSSDGNPGYFALKLNVYGRDGMPCRQCGAIIRRRKGARSMYFCANCQK